MALNDKILFYDFYLFLAHKINSRRTVLPVQSKIKQFHVSLEISKLLFLENKASKAISLFLIFILFRAIESP